MKLRILSTIIISVLCLLSCTEPNVYTSLGLYDPLDHSRGTVKTVSIPHGSSFNLLDITDDYKGKIKINYEPQKDYNVIKQLTEREADTLIQTVRYLSRYGDLDSYLSRPLDAKTEKYCKNTVAFALDILDDISSFIETLSGNLKKAGIEINPNNLEAFFSTLENTVRNAGYETIKDYITIQLTINTIASVFDVLYILTIDTPYDVVKFGVSLWDGNGEVNLMENVSANAVELTSVLLDAISQIDLVGSDIDSFYDLSDIVEGIL